MGVDLNELDAEFEKLERRHDVYARTWWTTPVSPHREFILAHPEVRPVLNRRLAKNLPTGTQHVYAAPDGVEWDEDRVPEQLRILESLDAADRESAGGAENSGHVYFVLGLPGSGKSRTLRQIARAHASTAVAPISDADDVRSEFPEYDGGLGSGVVQVEAAVLTYGEKHLVGAGRQDRVLAGGGHALVDVIGDQRYLPGTIEFLARAGRRAYVLVADCPLAECKRRAKQRALETGRLVPMAVIDDKVGQPELALRAALETQLVAGWAVVDTSGTPKLVEGDGTFDAYV